MLNLHSKADSCSSQNHTSQSQRPGNRRKGQYPGNLGWLKRLWPFHSTGSTLQVIIGERTASQVTPISSKLFTLQAVWFVVIHVWQNTPVLQLPLEICMWPCVTVVKCPCTPAHLRLPLVRNWNTHAWKHLRMLMVLKSEAEIFINSLKLP